MIRQIEIPLTFITPITFRSLMKNISGCDTDIMKKNNMSNERTQPTKTNSATKKRNVNQAYDQSSHDMESHHDPNEEKYSLDDFMQFNAEKMLKFNFTPKVNPRLKVIKEEEQKYTPASGIVGVSEIESIGTSKYIFPFLLSFITHIKLLYSISTKFRVRRRPQEPIIKPK